MGDGTFEDQVSYEVGSNPVAIASGDFNGDGRIELVVSNQASGDVSVLLGNGDGTFRDQRRYAVGPNPEGIVSGDFNGDGHADLAVALSTLNSVSLLLNVRNTLVGPDAFVTNPHADPFVADLRGAGVGDVFVIDAGGDILWRKGIPQETEIFDPPVVINRGNPSRDIVEVETVRGPVLASVDATSNAISLYAWSGGRFAQIGSLPTGLLPAQVVAADLNGDGRNDLVVRNAGDGTLSVYWGRGLDTHNSAGAPFFAPQTLEVGLGVSDVSPLNLDRVAAASEVASGSGPTLDLVVTNKVTGEVGVLRNQGNGVFSSPIWYRGSAGLYAETSNSDGTSSLTTLEATAGAVAGPFTLAEPTDLLTINPGSNTLGLLAGLGAGRFANPMSIPTAEPSQVVRVADFNHDGIPDIAVLTADTVDIYLGKGNGGFAKPVSYNAGPEPTGLTVADINHDGNPDLLIGNPYGDVLVLAGQGDGTFRPLLDTGKSVALAVADLNGKNQPDFVFADQGLDRVSVQFGGTAPAPFQGKAQGLLAPGAIALADLNGDGIKDLIVANSGGNNVLVYPGLGGGKFGPEANGGKGFFTGTDPVGVTVADLGNGRQDLVIADEGSNDVSILLNQGGFSFVPGPRLNLKSVTPPEIGPVSPTIVPLPSTEQGIGPVATALVPSTTGGPPSLAVSLSGSNQVWVIPGVGGGFFNDQKPTIFNVGTNPGPIFVGNFDGLPDLVTVNAGSNDLTLISDFNAPDFTVRTIASGGVNPVSAFAFESGGGFESLVVGNEGGGVLALLRGGPEGLTLASTLTETAVPSPTSLAFSALSGGQVEFYAATAGREAAIPLEFNLDDIAAPAPAASNTLAQLVPLSESSLALVGSLLTTSIQTLDGESNLAAGESEANAAVAFPSSPGPSVAQALSRQGGYASTGSDDGEGEAVEIADEPESEAADPPSRSSSAWKRYLLGIDRAGQKPAPAKDRVPLRPATGAGPSTSVMPRREGGPAAGSVRSDIDAPAPREPGAAHGGAGRDERIEWSLSAAVVWVVAIRFASTARPIATPGSRPSAPVRPVSTCCRGPAPSA